MLVVTTRSMRADADRIFKPNALTGFEATGPPDGAAFVAVHGGKLGFGWGRNESRHSNCVIFLDETFTREKAMSKKHKGGAGPVPAGNQSHFGSGKGGQEPVAAMPQGAPASEQDPKRRLGNYATAGEHAIEQPDG